MSGVCVRFPENGPGYHALRDGWQAECVEARASLSRPGEKEVFVARTGRPSRCLALRSPFPDVPPSVFARHYFQTSPDRASTQGHQAIVGLWERKCV